MSGPPDLWMPQQWEDGEWRDTNNYLVDHEEASRMAKNDKTNGGALRVRVIPKETWDEHNA